MALPNNGAAGGGPGGKFDGEILVPRRRPLQARSRQRFDQILAAARSVLVEQGFESFTFEEVARRAGVSIGAIYQYFANKYVLICELDRQDKAVTIQATVEAIAHLPSVDWPDVLDALIEHLAEVWEADPSRGVVWYAVQSTPATRATTLATQEPLVTIIAEAITPLSPHLDEQERRRVAEILLHTVTSVLNYGTYFPVSGPLATKELKHMVASYLLNLLNR